MTSKVYLVRAEDGIWDDWRTYNIVAFLDRDAAERYVKQAAEYAQSNPVGLVFSNPYDVPGTRSTLYDIEEIELRGAEGNP